MLLLLRGAPPANPSVTFALQSGLAFNNSPAVAFTTVTSLGPFDSVELQVSVSFDLHTTLTPIPFLTVGPGVSFATQMGLGLFGGFSDQVSFANTLNSGWTVGTTLQGAVTFATQTSLTGGLAVLTGVSFSTVLGLNPGTPVLSGGTLTPGVSFGLLTQLAGTPYLVDSAHLDLDTDFTGTLTLFSIGFPGPVETIRFEHLSRSIRFMHQ